MHVALGPYRGFAVNNVKPIAPPNPRCCSDPKVLCGRCAAIALKREGFTANCSAPVDNADPELAAAAALMDYSPSPLTFNIEDEQPEIVVGDDLMDVPALDFSAMVCNRERREQRKHQPDHGERLVVANDEVTLMDAPQINFAEIAARR